MTKFIRVILHTWQNSINKSDVALSCMSSFCASFIPNQRLLRVVLGQQNIFEANIVFVVDKFKFHFFLQFTNVSHGWYKVAKKKWTAYVMYTHIANSKININDWFVHNSLSMKNISEL